MEDECARVTHQVAILTGTIARLDSGGGVLFRKVSSFAIAARVRQEFRPRNWGGELRVE